MSSRISNRARKSLVIVADKNDRDAYCSGCVMIKDSTVTVIAPFAFVQGRERHLKVVFFDRKELDATLIFVQDSFCSLRTAFHSGCEKMCLLEHDIDQPQGTFMYAPQSRRTSQKLSTYATMESLESYVTYDEGFLTANSTNYFMVSCPYFGKTRSGINRLSGAAVFTMLGKVAGIVLQDCRHEVNGAGAEMKVTLKATCLRELIMLLDPPASQSSQRKKRKRTDSPLASGHVGTA